MACLLNWHPVTRQAQLLLNARGSDRGAVLCGDVIHSPLQLSFPDISSAICEDRQQATRTRRHLLSRLCDNGDFLLPGHFADPGWCQIRAVGDGFEMR